MKNSEKSVHQLLDDFRTSVLQGWFFSAKAEPGTAEHTLRSHYDGEQLAIENELARRIAFGWSGVEEEQK